MSRWAGLRLAIATVLLAAAGLKGYQLATAPLPPDAPLPRWLLTVVVEAEVLLGLWLLLGGLARAAWTASVALFGIFAVYTGWQLLTGAASCGCFGQFHVPPALTLAIDLSILAALAVCRPPQAAATHAWQVGLPLLLVVLTGPPAALAMNSYRPVGMPSAGGTVVLEPATWTGQPLPIAEHIAIDADLNRGRWTVVLYRRGCGSCREDVPRFERQADRWAEEGRDERIALVSLPPHADPAKDLPSGRSAAVVGRLDDSHHWYVRTPAIVRIADGTVIDPADDTALAAGSPSASSKEGG